MFSLLVVPGYLKLLAAASAHDVEQLGLFEEQMSLSAFCTPQGSASKLLVQNSSAVEAPIFVCISALPVCFVAPLV